VPDIRRRDHHTVGFLRRKDERLIREYDIGVEGEVGGGRPSLASCLRPEHGGLSMASVVMGTYPAVTFS
jgi:hypothetical protein